jgi:hypothetical protein
LIEKKFTAAKTRRGFFLHFFIYPCVPAGADSRNPAQTHATRRKNTQPGADSRTPVQQTVCDKAGGFIL